MALPLLERSDEATGTHSCDWIYASEISINADVANFGHRHSEYCKAQLTNARFRQADTFLSA
ncbi:hypothetical protein IHE49_18325 [Rhodanobacter sp. 7MK24]|uniref:hypothetical protein n=1 Tax=Rhodanobacter sp. 7MK24 TaxID=2775922 RepID=UPI00177C5903|nr:hypothetical protein [Rhodanobacter sp. 7MK24]MBD8882437.1 hypothetical protein [Rhodanobacter sp. 7MK24]